MRQVIVNGQVISEQEALKRAGAVRLGFTWLGGHAYKVASESQPGWTYRVVAAYGEARCSCRAGRDGRVCKHGCMLALLTLEDRPVKSEAALRWLQAVTENA